MSRKSGKSANKSGNEPVGSPGSLPVFTTGWGAGNINFSDNSTFWDEANRLISEGQVAGSLDAAMDGNSSPRVWLFLHEPGEAHLSVAVALNFARELANRDQAVLLLDGDDEKADLTRWAGRTDIDGWIDLVRYGSSVLTCGIPMPFEGRRGYLLGVGSFTPADVTKLEVADLVARLKRQADDILITAPADAVGRLWAAEADLRLLCWNRAERSPSLVNSLLESFEAVGIGLTGLVGFGLPKEFEDEPEAIEEKVFDDPVENIEPEKEIDPEEKSDPEEEEAPTAASEILNDLAQEDDDIQDDEEIAPAKGNSGIFWLVAMVSVVLISVAGGYYYKYVRVPSEGDFPVVSQNEEIEPNDSAGDASMGESTTFDDGITNGQAQDEATVDSAEGTNPGIVDQGNEPAELDPDDIIPEVEEGQIESDNQPEEIIEEQPLVVEQPLVEETPVVKPANGMAPFLNPVGGDGWALHVYSFPDSLTAEKERALLAAKGFQSLTRAVQFKEKGRWFRVYVGSFESKNEANAARRFLLEKLGEDWANPVRF